MKNLKLKIISAVMAVALAFGIGFAPVVASAEETTETPVESTETVETPENTDDTATDEETPGTEENGEITSKEESDVTLEDLLAYVGKLAEEEGLGKDWNSFMEQVKIAIEEEKISVMLIVYIIGLVLMSCYLAFKSFGKIVAWIKRKKHPSTVEQDLQAVQKTNMSQTEAVNAQTKAINSLAETDEHVAETVEKENAKIVALAEAQEGTNEALRCIVRGIGIKTELKDEAFRALNNSNAKCDIAKK